MISYESLVDYVRQDIVEESLSALLPVSFLSDCVLTKEPVSISEALKSPEAKLWHDAALQEIKSLQERDTWSLVQIPAGRKLIDNTWVFKRKLGPEGEVARYKARLLHEGFPKCKALILMQRFHLLLRFAPCVYSWLCPLSAASNSTNWMLLLPSLMASWIMSAI